MVGLGIVAFLVVVVVGIYFWKGHPIRLSVAQILQNVAAVLPLKNPELKKYPSPTIVGEYFGFRMALEGGFKNRFLATIELPKLFNGRIFIQSEERKTSLKPIAELKLVSTPVEKFNQHFLLLASDEKLGQAVFQPYLCEKILSLSETNWQLDVQGKEAHFEVWQPILSGSSLSELFKVVVECLNALLVAKTVT